MPRQLPDVLTSFVQLTQSSLDVASATEALWLTAPPASQIRQQLKVGQLEALYESVYLRVFTAWENVLESLTVYYLTGYQTANYAPVLAPGIGRPGSLRQARSMLLGNRSYLLWHNPQQVGTRLQSFLTNSPIETTLLANRIEIEDFAAIRHGIAHASDDAKDGVRQASLRLCGSEHKTPGRFLRSARLDDPLNQTKWLLIVRNRLVDLVNAMT